MLHALSYWEERHFFSELDVVIVGAGIVGLNAGIRFLELNPELRILILERSNIPHGASTRNAGFACFGSPSELIEDLKTTKPNEVFELFSQRYHGIQALINRTKNFNIEFEREGGQEVLAEDNNINEEQLQYLNAQIESYISLKEYFRFEPDKLNHAGLKNLQNLIYTPHESCLNPMKMIDALLQIYQNKGGKILFNSEIKTWKENDNGVEITLASNNFFSAQKILFAVNGFAQKLLPQLNVRAARNQVMVIQSDQSLKLKGCYHFDKGFVYFRQVNGNLLIGGGRNQDLEAEYSDEMIVNEKIKNYLLDFVRNHLLETGQIHIINHWVGILGFGSERKPIIEKISSRIGVAVRLSGVGIAIGTLIGNKGAEMMIGSNLFKLEA